MDFDPYWQWLQIPVDRRPPTYYDLLGLPALTGDAQRIHAAHRERYAYVRNFALGDYGEQANEILSELSLALDCLTDGAKKRAYDKTLGGVRPLGRVKKDGETPPAEGPTEETSSDGDDALAATLDEQYADFRGLIGSPLDARQKAHALLRYIEPWHALPLGCEAIWDEARAALAQPPAQRPTPLIGHLLWRLHVSNIESYCWRELASADLETYFHCVAQLPSDRLAAVGVLSRLVADLSEPALWRVIERYAKWLASSGARPEMAPLRAALAARLAAVVDDLPRRPSRFENRLKLLANAETLLGSLGDRLRTGKRLTQCSPRGASVSLWPAGSAHFGCGCMTKNVGSLAAGWRHGPRLVLNASRKGLRRNGRPRRLSNSRGRWGAASFCRAASCIRRPSQFRPAGAARMIARRTSFRRWNCPTFSASSGVGVCKFWR